MLTCFFLLFIQLTEYRVRSVEYCSELLAHVHCLAEENLNGTTHGIRIVAIQPEKPPAPRQTKHYLIDKQHNTDLLIYTDGGRKKILSRRQLIFGEQLYAVDGFSNKISDVHSFEAEEVPIIAVLLLGERIRGATLFTDSESVY